MLAGDPRHHLCLGSSASPKNGFRNRLLGEERTQDLMLRVVFFCLRLVYSSDRYKSTFLEGTVYI